MIDMHKSAEYKKVSTSPEQSELSELPELKDISASSEILRLKNLRMMRYYRLHRDMCNPNYSRKELAKQYMKDVYRIDQAMHNYASPRIIIEEKGCGLKIAENKNGNSKTSSTGSTRSSA